MALQPVVKHILEEIWVIDQDLGRVGARCWLAKLFRKITAAISQKGYEVGGRERKGRDIKKCHS